MTQTILELIDIEKSFFAASVLKGVSFEIESGQTLGLVGENGAGKSTLMNILGGNLAADSGTILLAGNVFEPQSPRDAEEAGIAFIHQELNLFGNLSIAENIFITRFPMKFGRIDRSAMHAQTKHLLDQVGLDVSPGARVEKLSAGERQLVEIAKAINLDARIIIFDEPTTSLTQRETDRLFELLCTLQSRGMTMIYISHALQEIRKLCHQVVVLRDGQITGNGPTSQFSTDDLISMMVGRDYNQQFPVKTSQPSDQVVFSAQRLSQPDVIRDISFELHRGEVLGISGLMGSGRTELARILFGLDPLGEGEIELLGKPITKATTRQRIRRGLAMVTESRRTDGLCMGLSTQVNTGLVSAPRHAKGPLGWLRWKSLSGSIEDLKQSIRLTTDASPHERVQVLSGGNQQKVVFSKWLLNQPQVLILDEPTRGIDVGAKYEIYTLIDRLAASGSGVLVISSELEELLGICDRILVMCKGEIRDAMAREEFDHHRIMRASLNPETPQERAS